MTDQRPSSDHSGTEVLFNAECAVCNFEISQYAEHAAKEALPIRFDDLNVDDLEHWGIDADRAARRLHVRHEGELVSGIDAFIVLWAQMPRYQRVGRIVALPGVRQVVSFAYDYVLAPAIYWLHLRREARKLRRG